MKKTSRILFLSLFILLILGIGGAWYYRANDSWQDAYRKQVSEDIIRLVQNNPLDKLNVVVIVIDGLRWEEGIGAQGEYIPHIWNDLRPMGTLLTNYRIDSPTATTSVHTAMLSGRISTVPNDGHIRPLFPTILEYYRDARSDYIETNLERITDVPAGIFRPTAETRAETGKLEDDARLFGPEKTALYLGKDLIYSLDQSSSGRYPDDDVLLIDSRRDIEVEEYFRAKIPDVKPNMVFVNLGDTDECAHEGQWHYYVDALRRADTLVWDMWQALQAQAKYRDHTLFIVTTDHGRHIPARGGYFHHGCFCDSCRSSFMLLIGPGIKQDSVSDTPHSEVDLVPTIGSALGIATPGTTGSPMMEVFENPDALPQPIETETMKKVAEDKGKVDNRDTAKILLDALITQSPKETWGCNESTAMLLLAAQARIDAHPDEAADLIGKLPIIQETDFPMENYSDIILAYPFIALGGANEESGSNVCFGYAQRGEAMYQRAKDAGLLGPWDPGAIPEIGSFSQIALTTSLLAARGWIESDQSLTRSAYALLLDALTKLEGKDIVWEGNLESLIGSYEYRGGPNVIFTESDPAPRDKMWLLWGIERTLVESDPAHVPDLRPLLERQYRLLVAFCSEWQDANAMIGGTGDLAESIDLPSQGLSLASIAEFKPWRRWELDQLGYSTEIYRTPLFDFPFEHLFYILGQANALAGAWTADERLKLFINDDGSIRGNLLDTLQPFKPGDPNYALDASSLAYGLSRFEKADYDLFDLELYPIVHQ